MERETPPMVSEQWKWRGRGGKTVRLSVTAVVVLLLSTMSPAQAIGGVGCDPFWREDDCSDGSPAVGSRPYSLAGDSEDMTGIGADDALSVCVNGVRVCKTYDSEWKTRCGFSANPGDLLRVRAYDCLGGCRGVTPLWIRGNVFVPSAKKQLDPGVPGVCDGSPANSTAFFDETFEIPDFPGVGLARVTASEPDEQIVPADRVTLRATFLSDVDVDVEVALATGESELFVGLGTAKLIAGAGWQTVEIPTRVVDERNPEIIRQVLDASSEGILLDSRVTFELTYDEGDGRKTETVKGSLFEPDEKTVWSITYPDYSKQTGEPPLTMKTDEALAAEAKYYREGSPWAVRQGDEPLTPMRSWAVRALRYQKAGSDADESTPDVASEAARNLARFFADQFESYWFGSVKRASQIAAILDAGDALPRMACIGQTMALGAFARAVGLRAREIDNAHYRFAPVSAEKWSQHATLEMWYGAAWHWFDLFYWKDAWDSGPESVESYCETLPYRFISKLSDRVRSFRAVRDIPANGQEAYFELDTAAGVPQWSSEADRPDPADPWVAYKDVSCGYWSFNVTTHSPVRTLYVDGSGRRLGAAGSLADADLFTPEKVAPFSGNGIVWDVPGGVYVAPGSPRASGPFEPEWAYYEDELLVIPYEEVTGRFSLVLRAIDSGPYGLDIWLDTGETGNILYSTQGTVTGDEIVQVDFVTDLGSEGPTVTETGRRSLSISEQSDAGDLQSGGGGCGVCSSGAGLSGMPILALLGMLWMVGRKARVVGRRCAVGRRE